MIAGRVIFGWLTFISWRTRLMDSDSLRTLDLPTLVRMGWLYLENNTLYPLLHAVEVKKNAFTFEKNLINYTSSYYITVNKQVTGLLHVRHSNLRPFNISFFSLFNISILLAYDGYIQSSKLQKSKSSKYPQ